MKTRQLCFGENQAILKLRKDASIGESLYNNLVLKKKETAGVLSKTHRAGRPMKTTAIYDRNIVRAVKKNPKTSVSDITTNLHRAGVKVSQSNVSKRASI